jgi:hypothetical protein
MLQRRFVRRRFVRRFVSAPFFEYLLVCNTCLVTEAVEPGAAYLRLLQNNGAPAPVPQHCFSSLSCTAELRLINLKTTFLFYKLVTEYYTPEEWPKKRPTLGGLYNRHLTI